MLLEQFLFTGDIAAVAFGKNVFSHRLDRLARYDLAADAGLNRDLEHLTGNHFFQFFGDASAAVVRVVLMHDQRERVADFPVQHNVEFDEFALLEPHDLVIHTSISARARFQVVEKVVNDLRERDVISQLSTRGIDVTHIEESPAFPLA